MSPQAPGGLRLQPRQPLPVSSPPAAPGRAGPVGRGPRRSLVTALSALSLLALLGAGSRPTVARAEEPLVDLPLPRPAPRGNALLPGRDEPPGKVDPRRPEDTRAAREDTFVPIPDAYDVLTLGTSLAVDLAGRLRSVVSLSGRVAGVATMASLESTLVAGDAALGQMKLSLFDPDYRWAVEAGDLQTLDGLTRGARLGWRNGLVEPSIAVGRRLDGADLRGDWLGSAGLTLLLGPHLSMTGSGSTSGRTRAALELTTAPLRLGLSGTRDVVTGEGSLTLSSALFGWGRSLEAAFTGTVSDTVAGTLLALQSRFTLRAAHDLEGTLSYGVQTDAAGDVSHSALARLAYKPGKHLALAAGWQSVVGLLNAHQATLRVGWRPSRAIDAVLELESDPLAVSQAIIRSQLGWVPTAYTILRIATTLPLGSLLPEVSAELEQRLVPGLDLRAEATRDGAGRWSGRLTVAASLGLDVPRRGAEIAGRVVGPTGEGLADVVVMAGPYRCRTDAEGRFSFTPLGAGHYQVEVDSMSLPATLSAAGVKHLLEVGRLDAEYLDFRVVAYGRISGRACVDGDDNGRCDPGEGQALGLFRLGARLAAPEPDGRFAFDNVLPGPQRVTFDPDYLRKGFELASAAEVPATLDQGQALEVVFLFREKRRAIKFDTL